MTASRNPRPWGVPGGPWAPLLEGEEAARAWEAIGGIAAALANPAPSAAADLAGGHAGHALFFAYLAEATGAQADAAAAEAHLDAAIAALAEQPLGPGLFSGFTGVGWVFEHLAGRVLPPDSTDEQATEEIDSALADLLGRGTLAVYDLVDGLAGTAVYALEGLPRPGARRCLELVLGQLEELSQDCPPGTSWLTPAERMPTDRLSPAGHYDLGVAHGVSGVLPVLAGCLAAGVEPERARALLEPAVAWLLAQEQEPGQIARFPNWTWPGRPPETSRLAWCYGDAGIVAALLLTARLAGRADWEAAARRLGRAAAARPPERCGVQDAGLCHGAAGLGHVLHRLYRATGEAAMAVAAREWLGRALALRDAGEGVGGFSSWDHSRGAWTPDGSYLTGAAGTGLALIAAVAARPPDWDRALLIAVPPGGDLS